jgi:hypothetical protein
MTPAHLQQSIIDKAVNIATRNAMNGTPVEWVEWFPPTSAASNPLGFFAITLCKQYSASEAPSWER